MSSKILMSVVCESPEGKEKDIRVPFLIKNSEIIEMVEKVDFIDMCKIEDSEEPDKQYNDHELHEELEEYFYEWMTNNDYNGWVIIDYIMPVKYVSSDSYKDEEYVIVE